MLTLFWKYGMETVMELFHAPDLLLIDYAYPYESCRQSLPVAWLRLADKLKCIDRT